MAQDAPAIADLGPAPCTREYHTSLCADANRFLAEVDYLGLQPGDDEVPDEALGNCKRCGSTIAYSLAPRDPRVRAAARGSYPHDMGSEAGRAARFETVCPRCGEMLVGGACPACTRKRVGLPCCERAELVDATAETYLCLVHGIHRLRRR